MLRVVAATLVVTAAVWRGTVSGAPAQSPAPQRAAAPDPPSSSWLSALPDGEEKRKFILDCTGCHVLDAKIARTQGRAKTPAEWEQWTTQMLSFAGAKSGFPVIAHDRDPAATGAWLARHLPAEAPVVRPLAPSATMRVARADAVTEFMMPEPRDLPHDVAVTKDGEVVITGMMTHTMYVLDPASGRMETVPIPVQRANPRAVEIDAAGNWWVVLGNPRQLARRDARSGQWRTFDVGFYAHSVAIDSAGGAWGNAHFSKAPEIMAHADPATGRVRTVELPPHPAMASVDGGPIPYEIRTAPDGRIWMGELQGNRLIAYDPRTSRSETFDMPTPFSGPRRFDVDARGALWIPAYATNELVRLDPATRQWKRWTLPVKDAVPYVARVDHGDGTVWLGTSAADAVFAFDPRRERWTAYPLPARGALVRHLAIDPRTHDVWAAYGASPGIPARIARIRPQR